MPCYKYKVEGRKRNQVEYQAPVSLLSYLAQPTTGQGAQPQDHHSAMTQPLRGWKPIPGRTLPGSLARLMVGIALVTFFVMSMLAEDGAHPSSTPAAPTPNLEQQGAFARPDWSRLEQGDHAGASNADKDRRALQ